MRAQKSNSPLHWELTDLWQKSPRTHSRERAVFSVSSAGKPVSMCRRMKSNSHLSLITAITSKWIKDIWNTQICESCKSKHGKYSQALVWVKSVLEMIPTVLATKTDTEKWGPINLQRFYTTKDTAKFKRQAYRVLA